MYSRNDGQEGNVRLTARQREVLIHVAMGESAEQIAYELGITPRTVRAHTDALRGKLAVPRSRDLPFAYRKVTGLDPLTDAPASLPSLVAETLRVGAA